MVVQEKPPAEVIDLSDDEEDDDDDDVIIEERYGIFWKDIRRICG